VLKKLFYYKQRQSRRIWFEYFKASIEVIFEWYGINRQEVLDKISEIIRQGYVGDEVFEEVKKRPRIKNNQDHLRK
jgi:hypothetical protein